MVSSSSGVGPTWRSTNGAAEVGTAAGSATEAADAVGLLGVDVAVLTGGS
jgi:hypothetical protein